MLRYFIQDRIEGARFDFFPPQIFDEIIDVFQSFFFLTSLILQQEFSF